MWGMVWRLNPSTGVAEGVRHWERRLSEMPEAFGDREALVESLKEGDPIVYEVYEVYGIPKRTGELIWSTTVLRPGKVGNEYFMTKGHYHRNAECAEVYLVLSGQGFLLLKGEDGPQAIPVQRGSVTYIPPGCAHRMVNTGTTPLVFFAVYPAQAGHDYEGVKREGFGIRVVEGDTGPEVCPVR